MKPVAVAIMAKAPTAGAVKTRLAPPLTAADAAHLYAASPARPGAGRPARDADVVVGPCDDGGYYLIGVRAERPELFEDMPWSTPGVLPETLRRARAAGLTTACLPEWFDVDTADDLERLRASLIEPGAAAPEQTARFFAELRRPRASG